MTSKAYYGCEFVNYNTTTGVTHNEFVEMLVKTISFRPKLWNMVKFTTATTNSDEYTYTFSVIFNNIADDNEFNEFAEAFKNLKTTEVYGLEL